MAQKRSIFEEVGNAERPAPGPTPGLIDRGTAGARRAIRLWLLLIFALPMVLPLVYLLSTERVARSVYWPENRNVSTLTCEGMDVLYGEGLTNNIECGLMRN